MGPVDRLVGCFAVAAIAWFIAKAMGVPIWRSWNPGDRCDLAVLAFTAAWLFSRARP